MKGGYIHTKIKPRPKIKIKKSKSILSINATGKNISHKLNKKTRRKTSKKR